MQQGELMLLKPLLAALLTLICAPVQAMSFIQYEDMLVMVGKVEVGDDAAFARLSGYKHIVLKDGPGGNLETALTIGQAVRDAKATTSVDGYCYSSCAMIFLGGVKRTLRPNAELGFHGSTDTTGGYSGSYDARMINYASFMTAGRFKEPLAAIVFYELKKSDLLLIQDKKLKLRRGKFTTNVSYTPAELGILN